MSGKGDVPRPIPDRPKFESEWDRIFGVKSKDNSTKDVTDGEAADLPDPRGV